MVSTPKAILRSYRLQRIAIDQVPTRTSQCGLLRNFDWRRSVDGVCFGSKADISAMPSYVRFSLAEQLIGLEPKLADHRSFDKAFRPRYQTSESVSHVSKQSE